MAKKETAEEQSMKVGIDGMLLSGTFSGVEKYIFQLFTSLGHTCKELDLHVFVPFGFKREGIKRDANICIERAFCSGRIRTLRIFWEHFWLPFKIVSYGFDLIHFPAYIHPYVKGIPTVLTVHDIIAIQAPELCKRSNVHYYRRFLKRSIERATRIVTPSERVKKDIWSVFKKPKTAIDVIPMGTDIMTYPCDVESVRKKYNINRPYILYVGNIEPKKGVSLLIKAFFAASMYKKFEHVLVITGKREWKSRPIIRLARELGSSFKEKVIFTGYVPEKDLSSLYSGADLFVFPSLIEGFGIPPLEAMSCGTPVLLSNEPSLRETYKECAHFFKNGNVMDLREKYESLIENKKERIQFVQKGKKLAEKLSWEQCARNTSLTYKKAIEDFHKETNEDIPDKKDMK